MRKKVLQKTLDRKKRYWQKVLKMTDWNIKIKFVPKYKLSDINSIAELESISGNEKAAQIFISSSYHSYDGYNLYWNIDTIILHEMIHIKIDRQREQLNKKLIKSDKFYDFEEFICDTFSNLIYDFDKKSKKSTSI